MFGITKTTANDHQFEIEPTAMGMSQAQGIGGDDDNTNCQ